MSKYHVALSFAGEDRPYVEKVASALRAEGVNVFYDMFEEADLWGKDLYTHLSDVYQNLALFTVMFVSEAYQSKLWTTHERKSAQARAFSDSKEYILPAKFDESIEIPGLLKTTGYVSLKTKTPDQLAALIVQKLKRSGVTLSQEYGYSENARADVDFPLPKGKKVPDIIRALKSHTWGTQHPAVVELLELDWNKVKPDEAFVLGRNRYQTACGGERRAEAALRSIRKEMASLPEDRAIDVVNGMLYEVYFDSKGEFRGRKLKSRHLGDLLELQKIKKYQPSVGFIRRSLEPYRSDLLFLPSTEPEVVQVDVQIRKSDPPTIRSLSVGGRNLLTTDPDADDNSSRLWKLSYQNFTLSVLHEQLAEEWGIPAVQLQVICTPALDPKAKLRLPEGASFLWPASA
jgi:hypothetical protein